MDYVQPFIFSMIDLSVPSVCISKSEPEQCGLKDQFTLFMLLWKQIRVFMTVTMVFSRDAGTLDGPAGSAKAR